MKNLSVKIEGQKVTWTLIKNTLTYTSTTELLPQVDAEVFTSRIIEQASRVELVLSEINEGSEQLFLEELIVFDSENRPLVGFEKNKGKRLNDSQKAEIMAKIEESIMLGEEFTELTVFELRANDLLSVVVFDKMYIYQAFDNQYIKF